MNSGSRLAVAIFKETLSFKSYYRERENVHARKKGLDEGGGADLLVMIWDRFSWKKRSPAQGLNVEFYSGVYMKLVFSFASVRE